jgi:hypothetical protein
MNRIQRIKTFLGDHRDLEPWLQNLTKEAHHHYQLELIREYLKLSRHPYPTEYLHP